MASKFSNEEFKAVFGVFDLDNSGKINCSELEEAIKQLNGVAMTSEEIKRMMEISDINHDGEISFKEFKKLMRGQAESEVEVKK